MTEPAGSAALKEVTNSVLPSGWIRAVLTAVLGILPAVLASVSAAGRLTPAALVDEWLKALAIPWSTHPVEAWLTHRSSGVEMAAGVAGWLTLTLYPLVVAADGGVLKSAERASLVFWLGACLWLQVHQPGLLALAGYLGVAGGGAVFLGILHAMWNRLWRTQDEDFGEHLAWHLATVLLMPVGWILGLAWYTAGLGKLDLKN